MPFLRTEHRPYVRRGKAIKRFHDVGVYRCDACDEQYERRGGYQLTQASKHGHTYCSSKCFGVGTRVGTPHADAVRAEHLSRHGVEHPLQRTDVKEKRFQTNVERYGGRSPCASASVSDKVSQSLLARSPQEKDEWLARSRMTLAIRYGEGVTNPMHVPGAVEKVVSALVDPVSSARATSLRRETNVAKYGVQWPMQLSATKDKSRITSKRRYGVEHPMQSEGVKAKVELTNLARRGVRNPQQDPDVRHRTSKNRKNVVVIPYWKTGEERAYTASYERAFAEWAAAHCVEYEWQVPHDTGDGHRYFIDAHVLSGRFGGKWIEIKGFLDARSQRQCLSFAEKYGDDFELWDRARLVEVGAL
jgi:hypothetical protein